MSDQRHFLLRPDLIRRRIWMGDRPIWVVKDPLSRELTYFSEQEYAILDLADGQRTVRDIHEVCTVQFAPLYFSPESLTHFLAEAAAKKLLVVRGHVPTKQEEPRRRFNPLAMRLPGLNPDRWLDRCMGVARVLFAPPTLAFALLVILTACLICLVNFDRLADHVTVASQRINFSAGLLTLMAVIAGTKIIHELAHAFACKFFGGECREVGVMLLVGVPCLYCDVSDAWLLDRRWKRIVISAAGMLAELVLAAFATFVWMLAADGFVRDLCVTVIVVCSVTTVIFNGNPLLRYDGYYILSDLVGIPNLAAESGQVIRGWFRRLIWSVPSRPTEWNSGLRRQFFLFGYGVASGVYRFLVYGLIAWMLYQIARSYEMETLFGVAILLGIGRLAYRWVISVMTPPVNAAPFANFSRRPMLVVASVLFLITVMGAIPLPHHVRAPMSVQSSAAQQVFASLPGRVEPRVRSGQRVEIGQVIAKLENSQIARELVALQAECDRLDAQLTSLRQTRGSDVQAKNRLPLIEESFSEAQKQLMLRKKDSQRLLLKASRSGRVYFPAAVTENRMDSRASYGWDGSPLEPENQGAWIEQGTVLAVVGDAESREALLLLKQQDIELIRLQQSVQLRLADCPRGSVAGRVVEVSVAPVDMVPEELIATGHVDSQHDLKKDPLYQVRVALSTNQQLPIRLVGNARVQVRSASLWQRLLRFLGDSFG